MQFYTGLKTALTDSQQCDVACKILGIFQDNLLLSRSGFDVVSAHDLNVKSDAFRHFLLAYKLCTQKKKKKKRKNITVTAPTQKHVC
ncbi:hypothetical protein ROHU_007146 [Labeo rohita]|uniref:Uncharacterized protein n=1 Tax=Labeo rohita TaxID=84645 RepID=A0A498MT61_LABRO|nr:hypothetical protein ROHU_007146 [Labeo rohita]